MRALLGLLAFLCAKTSNGLMWLAERLTTLGERLMRHAEKS